MTFTRENQVSQSHADLVASGQDMRGQAFAHKCTWETEDYVPFETKRQQSFLKSNHVIFVLKLNQSMIDLTHQD